MTWWQHLSWSQATFIASLAMLGIGIVSSVLATPRRGATRCRPKAWPIVDYSRQYQKKVAWLGDRYLLAKPINRRMAG